MTLIVAKRTGEAIAIASDLRVTDPDEIRRGYPFGILKTVAVSNSLAVAFAGPLDLALDGLGAAAEAALSLGPSGVSEVLRSHSLRGDVGPDFLVVSSNPARIDRIRGGAIEQDLSSAWVGDQTAFEAFQVAWASSAEPIFAEPLPARILLTSRMSQAFGNVVADPGVPSVGESSILVASGTRSELQYMTSAVSVAPRQPIPPGQLTPIRHGTAAEGGSAYSVLTPGQPGIGAIGLHFYQGRVGLLFHPLHDRYPVVYADLSHDEFREAVWNEFGFQIQGVIIN